MASADVPYSGLAGLGADLRAARERLGWDLPDLATRLRIQLRYLEALEDGRISDLPAAAYAVGFLRTYAAALGLDADDQVRRFKESGPEIRRPATLVFPAPVPERGLPAGAAALLAMVLAISVYAGWYRLSGEGRLPAEVVPPVPARLASLAEQAVPPTPQVRSSAKFPAMQAAAAPALSASLDLPAVAPSSAAAMPLLPPPVAAAALTRPEPSPGSLNSEEGRIVLRARADSWLQVRERNGAILLSRVLRAGESWPVPARSGLLLSTGNAGGTELVIDGVAAPALGGVGAVRRDLPLDAEAIRNGRLPAQMQAAAQASAAQSSPLQANPAQATSPRSPPQ